MASQAFWDLSVGAGLHLERAFPALCSLPCPSLGVLYGCPAPSDWGGAGKSVKGKEIGNLLWLISFIINEDNILISLWLSLGFSFQVGPHPGGKQRVFLSFPKLQYYVRDIISSSTFQLPSGFQGFFGVFLGAGGGGHCK